MALDEKIIVLIVLNDTDFYNFYTLLTGYCRDFLKRRPGIKK